MTPTMQLAVDCGDPHRLAEFWAAAVDYELEDHHEQIQQLLDAGYAAADDTIEIRGRLAWRTAAACRPRDGSTPRLLFQQVPEAKTGKNRVHLDLHLPHDRREGEIERLLELGATRLWDGQQGPHSWVTLADPEGNEFCIS